MFEFPSKKTWMEPASQDKGTQWFAEVSEHEFRDRVEYLYHSLQVRTRQAEAFDEWGALMGQAVGSLRRREVRLLLILVRQLVEEGEPFLSKTSELYGVYLLWYAGFLEQEVYWQQAQAVLEEAVKIFEQVSNQAGLSVALRSLAELYEAQGKYKQAEPLLRGVLAIREKQLGSEHPDTATSLGNLGALYFAQGKYEQAEPLLQHALAIREKQLGPDHPSTVNSLGCLAELYFAQGKYEQAGLLSDRAWPLVEKRFWSEHPDTE